MILRYVDLWIKPELGIMTNFLEGLSFQGGFKDFVVILEVTRLKGTIMVVGFLWICEEEWCPTEVMNLWN